MRSFSCRSERAALKKPFITVVKTKVCKQGGSGIVSKMRSVFAIRLMAVAICTECLIYCRFCLHIFHMIFVKNAELLKDFALQADGRVNAGPSIVCNNAFCE